MNTETSDTTVAIAGWLFYDADCPLCCASVRRFHRLLHRRGFEFRPLQSPGVAQQLGVDPSDLLREMQLLLADGRRLGGADAVVEIACHIGWAWPLWLIAQIPGVKPILRAIYRRVAANRHCAGEACRIPGRPARHDGPPPWLASAWVRRVRDAWARRIRFAPGDQSACRHHGHAQPGRGGNASRRHSVFFELP